MNKLGVIVAVVLGLGGVASAQSAAAPPYTPPELDPDEAVLPYNPDTEGKGIKVGDGTVINPIVGIETGVKSNVFYEADNGIASALMRFLVEVGVSSLSTQRQGVGEGPNSQNATNGPVETVATTSKGSFEYSANLFATYDQYLSSNTDVQAQGGLGGGLLFRAIANPGHTLWLSMFEDFDRVIRSTDFESTQHTNRDVNQFTLQLHYTPEGRALGGYVYFQERLDLFEDPNQRFADRFQNSVGVRVNYQLLPRTRVYVNLSEGLYTGIGDSSEKVTSYPLVAVVGVETAIGVNSTVQARVGYTQGFYTSGPDYAGITGGVQVGYRYSPLGRALILYRYEHEDSINANFFGEHLVQASVEQLTGPVLLYATGELHFRTYEGLIVTGNTSTRFDTIEAIGAGVRYGFKRNFAANLEYRFENDQTDFRYMTGGAGSAIDNPSYTLHEVLLGVRAQY